ncbi:MAG: hypothetical protein AB1807_17570 [Pseudomonadota bacterium]
MKQLQLHALMVGATIVMFCAALAVNELLFLRFEFAAGINWIYLPAGVRLLSTLLFAEAGFVGLFLVGWAACAFLFFPDDALRSVAGGFLGAFAPYLVYLMMRHRFGLQASLANLTPARLLFCAFAYSIASPLLHHIWFGLVEHKPDLLRSFVAMATGDFCGTIVVLYGAKLVLELVAPRRRPV